MVDTINTILFLNDLDVIGSKISENYITGPKINMIGLK